MEKQNPQTVYCSFKINHVPGKTSIFNIDLGLEAKHPHNYIADTEDNKLLFKTPIDALNYMAKFGWSLTTVTSDTDGLPEIYYMSKVVTSDADIKDGLNIVAAEAPTLTFL